MRNPLFLLVKSWSPNFNTLKKYICIINCHVSGTVVQVSLTYSVGVICFGQAE